MCRPIYKQNSTKDFSSYIVGTMGKSRQNLILSELLTGDPIDIRLLPLNCILDGPFRDTPLKNICHAQILAIKMRPTTANTIFGARIWTSFCGGSTHNFVQLVQKN